MTRGPGISFNEEPEPEVSEHEHEESVYRSEYQFERPSLPTPTLAGIWFPHTRTNAHFSRSYTHIKLTHIVDSLGSSLSAENVNSFTRNGKKPVEDELAVDEAIQCLETQVGRPPNEKKRVVAVGKWGLLLD
jgi:hypothetical protein